MRLRWTLGMTAGGVLAVFKPYTQSRLMNHRDDQWQGNYADADADEVQVILTFLTWPRGVLPPNKKVF